MSDAVYVVVRQSVEGAVSVVETHRHPDPHIAKQRALSAAERLTRLDSAGVYGRTGPATATYNICHTEGPRCL